MAEHTENVEELKDFFLGLNALFGHSLRAFQNKDTIGVEYCKTKLENYISIVVAMSGALSENVYTTDASRSLPLSHNSNLAMLLQDLVVAMEGELEKPSQVSEACPDANTTINVCSTLTSTGGRPAFKVKKEHIEQLRDTGMNWKQIANFLGVSARTLHRKRIEYGLEKNFSEISDADLDKQVQEVLQLTPYSGESYIRGSPVIQSEISTCGWNFKFSTTFKIFSTIAINFSHMHELLDIRLQFSTYVYNSQHISIILNTIGNQYHAKPECV